MCEVMHALVEAERPPELRLVRLEPPQQPRGGLYAVHDEMDDKVERRERERGERRDVKRAYEERENCMHETVHSQWRNEIPSRFELTEHVFALKQVVCDEVLQLED